MYRKAKIYCVIFYHYVKSNQKKGWNVEVIQLERQRNYSAKHEIRGMRQTKTSFVEHAHLFT